MLRVVTTCADFARDRDIQRDKSKDPFQPGVVYANFVRTQCSNASAIDCLRRKNTLYIVMKKVHEQVAKTS